jgi:hypothetical protein
MHWRIRRLLEDTRILLLATRTALRIVRRGTDFSRWSNDKSYDTSWKQRSAQIAAHIKPKSSVIDFGCGLMSLRDFLPEGCHYQPVDVVARAPETIICNFNQRELPPGKLYDVVVCAGLLEYIYDVDWFIENIVPYGRRFLVSYYMLTPKFPSGTARLRHGWVNSLSADDLVRKFTQAGLSLIRRERILPGEDLFEFAKPAP